MIVVLQHSGPLTRAIDFMAQEAGPYVEKRGIHRRRLIYEGPTTAPFTAYIRWQPGRVTVADITAQGREKQGRMDPFCTALERLPMAVRWESVVNDHIYDWLLRRGYLDPAADRNLIRYFKQN